MENNKQSTLEWFMDRLRENEVIKKVTPKWVLTVAAIEFVVIILLLLRS